MPTLAAAVFSASWQVNWRLGRTIATDVAFRGKAPFRPREEPQGIGVLGDDSPCWNRDAQVKWPS